MLHIHSSVRYFLALGEKSSLQEKEILILISALKYIGNIII